MIKSMASGLARTSAPMKPLTDAPVVFEALDGRVIYLWADVPQAKPTLWQRIKGWFV